MSRINVKGEVVEGRDAEYGKEDAVEKREEKRRHDHEGDDDDDEKSDQPRSREKSMLAAATAEDAPIQVQVISAACQSPSYEERLENKMGKKGDLAAEGDEESCPFYHPNYYDKNGRWTTVPTALLSLLFTLSNLLWSVGLCYWHFQRNNFEIAVTSLVIIILSGSITTVAFFATKSLPSKTARKNLWECSKLAWFTTAIPTLVPIVLSIVYFISSLLDNGSQLTKDRSGNSPGKNERRQCAKSNEAATSTLLSPSSTTARRSLPLIFLVEKWRACSVSFFLIESLTLCFPMCVLHLCALMEEPDSIPSLIGFFTLLGLFLFTFSITFSRFLHDSTQKRDRFGEGKEKYLRFCYLWSAKIIWLVTFGILIVTARVLYPDWRIEATLCAIGGLTAIHEIPLWICLLPRCGKLAAKLSSLFFLIPQFTSLLSLIYWVNIDPTVYHSNIGSIVLGVYFWSEAVMLCGWLADGNADKDIDLVPLYPHFFGDFISSCFEEKEIPYVQQ